MNQVRELAAIRPPSALDGVQATQLGEDDARLLYQVRCSCGSDTATIISELDHGEQFWADPIVFQCAACQSSIPLFDSRRHGYDAVLNNFSAYPPRETSEPITCRDCGADQHRVITSYRYDFPEEEVIEDWTDDERRQMPDLFSSAAFELTCTACGSRQVVGEFECA